MEAEQSDSLYNFLAWANRNRKRLLTALIVLAVVVTGYSIVNWKRNQTEIEANHALFALPQLLTATGQVSQVSADGYQKVAATYTKTAAGQRAALLAAGILFSQGKYLDAHAEFSKFIVDYPDSTMLSEAIYGVAAATEASGKTNEAVAKYEDVIRRYPGENVFAQSKIALGRIYETQNSPEKAFKAYSEISRPNPYDPWIMEATERKEQLVRKFPSLVKTNAPALAPSPGPAMAPVGSVPITNMAARTNPAALTNFQLSSPGAKKP